MSPETHNQLTGQCRRSRRHRHRSKFKKWLERIQTSRSAKKKLRTQLFIFAIVLAAFLFGLYAIGPIMSYTPRK